MNRNRSMDRTNPALPVDDAPFALDRPVSRRALLTRLAPAAALSAAGLARGHEASANTWCRRDPIVEVNGRRMHIYVSSLTEMLTTATGPVTVQVWTPMNATRRLLETDSGFGFGYTVAFISMPNLASGSTFVEVQSMVLCPTTNPALPVLVEFVPYDSRWPTQSFQGVAAASFSSNKMKM